MSPKKNLLLAASIAFLAACGDASAPAKTSIPTEPAVPIIETSPALTMNQFADLLADGGAILRLTECDENDAVDGYTGADDPLGVLVCQAEYKVSYDGAAGIWIVTGPKERAGVAADALPIMTHGYVGAAPREGMMVVWGGAYRFDAAGTVYPSRREESAIGQLTLNKE